MGTTVTQKRHCDVCKRHAQRMGRVTVTVKWLPLKSDPCQMPLPQAEEAEGVVLPLPGDGQRELCERDRDRLLRWIVRGLQPPGS